MIAVLYTILALVLLLQDKYASSAIFLSLAVLWAIAYPAYSRRYYVKHYKRFIQEQYRSPIERVSTVEISSDQITARDSGSESKIATTEIQEINEIPDLILLKVGPQNLIIPKHKIAGPADVTKELQALAAKLSIAYNQQPDWKWQ